MLLELKNIEKHFGGVIALDEVAFDLHPGEVHALLGENGAGKSTLINVIAGTYPRTHGTLHIDGHEVTDTSPQIARQLGVAAVFQEFSLVPDLSVEENLFLGTEICGPLFLKFREMRKRAQDLLDSVGFDLPLDMPVRRLTRAQKQMVEIAKGLRDDVKILILDEPTASLTDGEAEKLFAVVARLKARGIGIIYVSHRMPEIRDLSDRVTVLRGGRHIGTVRTQDVTNDALIEMMVGQKVEDLYPEIFPNPQAERLRVEHLTTRNNAVRDVSITLRAGEIVGLAGLVGCGRSELCRAIFGLQRVVEGEIYVGGEVFHHPTPSAMMRKGICYFPSDRHHEGLALQRAARENATMAALGQIGLSRFGILTAGAERSRLKTPFEKLGLRPMKPEQAAASFSGGNQQKIMLARGLMRPLQIYLFDEPTVGIDVGAKADVYRLIKELVEAGAAVILSSSELPELVHLSNRVYVMREGQLVAEVADQDVSEAGILAHYFDAVAPSENSEAHA